MKHVWKDLSVDRRMGQIAAISFCRNGLGAVWAGTELANTGGVGRGERWNDGAGGGARLAWMVEGVAGALDSFITAGLLVKGAGDLTGGLRLCRYVCICTLLIVWILGSGSIGVSATPRMTGCGELEGWWREVASARRAEEPKGRSMSVVWYDRFPT